MKKKKGIVEWAMHYRQIIIMTVSCLVAFGIYGLREIPKNEFPDFTIRQGIVVAACPGATAAEIEEQVTKPLEDYIFSYKEVRKEKTFSTSRDGLVYIQVELNQNLTDKDAFWSKFKHGVQAFKSELPQNVMALQVVDDFGDTSAMLITMESDQKTYREMEKYMDGLKDQLRKISSVGTLRVLGIQKEQISVNLNYEKLSQYGVNGQTMAFNLFTKGFTTVSGQVDNAEFVAPIHVAKTYNSVRDVQEQIVYADLKGNIVRLKDVADVVKEYPTSDSYIRNNGKKCILLSLEMKKGNNIVKMGQAVNNTIQAYEKTLPHDVVLYRITDQSVVVDTSVSNFLVELGIAVMAVVLVVLLLLPLRVALVASSTIPISIFIALGLFYAFGIELNTVTLAALIVTLGMIVDNSIVIIDSYIEKIGEGTSRWHASIQSATHFFKSIFSATLAISVTFFPLLLTVKGMTHDFLLSFPWAVTIVLLVSLLVAEMLVPFMQFIFIRKPIVLESPKSGKKKFSFLDWLQRIYNVLLDCCFANPYTTIALGVVFVVVGIGLFSIIPQKLLPIAQRNQFAVEIYTPEGMASERTAVVADSLEHILRKDKRVVSVTSFIGSASPRFHTTYAPQMAGTNFAQFIVNTNGEKETEEILDEYTPRYSEYFPYAVVRFKQMDYSEATSPIEIRLSGDSIATLKQYSEQIMSIIRNIPELCLVRTNYREQTPGVRVQLKEDEATRIGINNAALEATLAMRYSSGVQVATIWEGDYDIPVKLKNKKSDSTDYKDIANELIPVAMGFTTIPLRQVAEIVPDYCEGQIVRRNGVRTLTVMAEVQRGQNAIAATTIIKEKLKNLCIPAGVTIEYGGALESDNESLPEIMAGLAIAIVIIFFILVWHFHRINMALLIMSLIPLCLFGTAIGLLVQGVDFGVTANLGFISLMGILVRNGIIMLDYAEELRENEKMTVHQAIYESAKRRMRPIFLTSAAASMGVVSMILGGSSLWMPMGAVIFYGTLITMFFILTVLPVGYWLIFRGSTKKRLADKKLESE